MAIILKASTNFKGKFLRKGESLEAKKIPSKIIERWIKNGLAIKKEDSKKNENNQEEK